MVKPSHLDGARSAVGISCLEMEQPFKTLMHHPLSFEGIYVNRHYRRFPICCLQLWWYLLQSWYYHKARSHLSDGDRKAHCTLYVHNIVLSTRSSNIKEHCCITWTPAVLYRLTLATCAPTLSAPLLWHQCRLIAATSLPDFTYISGIIFHQRVGMLY